MDELRCLRLESFAPARVNIIGEHVDYLGGTVVPGSITLGCTAAISAVRLKSSVDPTLPVGGSVLTFESLNVSGPPVRFDFSMPVAAPLAGKSFATMCYGAVQEAWALADRLGRPQGATIEIVINADVPIGAGLSSSAALLVSVLSGLVVVFLAADPKNFFTPDLRTQVALSARRVENNYCGANVGIMDQYASVHGAPSTVMCVDCGALTHSSVALPPSLGIALIDSMHTHELTGQYNAIRSDLEAAEVALRAYVGQPNTTIRSAAGHSFVVGGVTMTAEACFKQLEADGALSVRQAMRGTYAVKEMSRVDAFMALANEYSSGGATDEVALLGRLGSILFAGHEGLSTQLGVSTPELDAIVGLCREHPAAVYGARMMGGGFGGCVVALVDPAKFAAAQGAIVESFVKAFPTLPPCRVYNVTLGAGSHVTAL